MKNRATVTVSLNLTYDGWKDLEGALLARAAEARRMGHDPMTDRLNGIRTGIEAQVREQKPRW